MRVSTLSDKAPGDVELGVLYASVEGVNANSYHECLEELTHKAKALALQLLYRKVSESMGNHDSKIVDWDSVD